jgi:hypothetical protein
MVELMVAVIIPPSPWILPGESNGTGHIFLRRLKKAFAYRSK